MRQATVAAGWVAVTLLAACGGRPSPTLPPPSPARLGAMETGMASWYGHPYHGRRTSNGEVYDMDELTAAHLSLPFDTQLLVVNEDNNRSVEVRINDRGPFIKNRIIDLSRAAARQIEMVGPGTARVRLEVISTPRMTRAERKPLPPQPPTSELAETCPPGPYFAVQAGSFRSYDNAARMRGKLELAYGAARVHRSEVDGLEVYRVYVGGSREHAAAIGLLGALQTDGYEGFVKQVAESEAAQCLDEPTD